MTDIREEITGVIKECGIDRARFHELGKTEWQSVLKRAEEKFADRTKSRKNDLHWANIDGYSPKLEQTAVTPSDDSWTEHLPEILPHGESFYVLMEGSCFDPNCLYYKYWVYEGFAEEISQVILESYGFHEMYIISKKFDWIFSENHHGVLTAAGDISALRLDIAENNCSLRKE